MARKKKQNTNTFEVQDAAKTLFANIRFMSVDDPVKSIVLTSTVPNEGKTTVAIELAKAVATSSKTVMLVEADMRRRSLAGQLGVRASAGLYGVLSGQAPLERAVVETSIQGISFLDAEPGIPNPVDIIGSNRFRSLSRKLEEHYDYVIYDTPPVGTFVDAAVLANIADGTVMVVRTDFVKRDEVTYAYEQLQKAGANVIGICATFVESSSSEYYYAYYTKDGRRVKKGEAAPESEFAPAAATSATPAAGTSQYPPVSPMQRGQSRAPQAQQAGRSRR